MSASIATRVFPAPVGKDKEPAKAALPTNKITDLLDDDLLIVMQRADLRWPFHLELAFQRSILEATEFNSEPKITSERNSGAATRPPLRRLEPTLLENVRVLLKDLRSVHNQREFGYRAVVEVTFNQLNRVDNHSGKTRPQDVRADREQ